MGFFFGGIAGPADAIFATLLFRTHNEDNMTKDTDTYSIYAVNTESEPGYGVRGLKGGMVYEANFIKDTAERIAELLNSSNQPEDWNATSKILLAEGYDIRCVTLERMLDKDVSAGRKHLQRAMPPTSAMVALGAFQVSTSIDSAGHLTVIINSNDGSMPVDVGDSEVGRPESELGYRFTTNKIEQKYRDTAG